MNIELDEKTFAITCSAIAALSTAIWWVSKQVQKIEAAAKKIGEVDALEMRIDRLEDTAIATSSRVSTLWHRAGLSEPERLADRGSQPGPLPPAMGTVTATRKHIIESVQSRPEKLTAHAHPVMVPRPRKPSIPREDPEDPKDGSGE